MTVLRARKGFTLFELIAAMAAASLLMVGLSASIFVAVQSVDVSGSPQVKVLESHRLLADMQSDLQFATEVTEVASDAFEVTIPDRDDPDTSPDTVRYAWAGSGQPLTRQYNGGDVLIVAESVHDLVISPYVKDASYRYVVIELKMTENDATAIVSTIQLLNQP